MLKFLLSKSDYTIKQQFHYSFRKSFHAKAVYYEIIARIYIKSSNPFLNHGPPKLQRVL
jgi:hypothetical protein